MRFSLPEGYVHVRQGGASAVVAAPCAGAVDGILAKSSVYDWASAQAERRELSGRGTAYAVSLPDCAIRVVVRRARHGGLLAAIRGDVFLAPTRAPRELALSLFLQHVGVATPTVLGYATYRVGPLLRRADVMTVEVPNAVDLKGFMAQFADPTARQSAWRATADLLQRLTQAGIWHPDLNAKNVLLTTNLTAVVVDIDRVRLVVPGDPQCAEANLARLLRSLRKDGGSQDEERELRQFGEMVRSAPLSAPAASA